MIKNEAVLFSHAKVNPVGNCPQSCFYFSCSLSWCGVLMLQPMCFLLEAGRSGHPCGPGVQESCRHICLKPLPSWLHLLSSCSACSLSTQGACRPPVVPTTVKASFSWFAGKTSHRTCWGSFAEYAVNHCSTWDGLEIIFQKIKWDRYYKVTQAYGFPFLRSNRRCKVSSLLPAYSYRGGYCLTDSFLDCFLISFSATLSFLALNKLSTAEAFRVAPQEVGRTVCWCVCGWSCFRAKRQLLSDTRMPGTCVIASWKGRNWFQLIYRM